MDGSFWDYILKYFEKSYYTYPLWLISMMITIIAGIKYYRKEKLFQFFLSYAVISILISTHIDVIKYYSGLRGRSYTYYLESSNTVFEMIELSVFFFFFTYLFNSKNIKVLIQILWIIFLGICIFFFQKVLDPDTQMNELNRMSFLINAIEFVLLIPFALYYFYCLLTKEVLIKKSLASSPAFWIVNGLFFYCIVSFPLLLMGAHLYEQNRHLYEITFSFHFMSLSILFLCLAKAFSCKTPLTS